MSIRLFQKDATFFLINPIIPTFFQSLVLVLVLVPRKGVWKQSTSHVVVPRKERKSAKSSNAVQGITLGLQDKCTHCRLQPRKHSVRNLNQEI
jgi:hypothetical protein